MERPAIGKNMAIALVLAAITGFVFAPLTGYPFISLDDPGYVVENTHIHDGPTLQALGWAWTTFEKANWHPLTWWSHMVDYALYEGEAGGHHLTNLILHCLNVAILFFLLLRLTAARWRSALVAGWFALHPLHVETVAWISERKDLLSTLFGLLAIGAYVAWAREGGARRYLVLLLLFAASLCSKPMLVTLPFVLVLLDYWPLERISGTFASLRRSLVEKIPLFALSVASSVLTMVAQGAGGAIADSTTVPLSLRLANAAVSYWRYLFKTFWPDELSIFYTYPSLEGGGGWSAGQVTLAALGLIAASALALFARHRWAAVGWLWFLGTLVPVIGLIQVGRQSIADRYTYLPSIGIFLIVAWAGELLYRRFASGRAVLGGLVALAVLSLAVCGALTRHQVGYWKDSLTLFEHALTIAPDASTVHLSLGVERALLRDWDRAEHHFTRARDIAPEMPEAYFNLGRLYAARGRPTEAVEHLRRAAAIVPDRAATHFHLGLALRQTQRPAEAAQSLLEAARLDPTWVAALSQAAWLLATSADPSVRDPETAFELADEAARLTEYRDPNALDILAAAHAAAGRYDRAAETASLASRFAEALGDRRKVEVLQRRIEVYRRGSPWIAP